MDESDAKIRFMLTKIYVQLVVISQLLLLITVMTALLLVVTFFKD